MNLKKNIIAFLAFIFITSPITAQYGTRGIKYVKKVKESETLFLLEGTKMYNAALKDAVEKYWTFSKYRFIQPKELEEHFKDEKKSFVRLINLDVSKSGSGGFNYDFFNMALFIGGKKKLKKYGKYDMIAYANMMTSPYFYDKSTASERYVRFFEILTKRNATKAEVIKGVQSINNYCHLVMKNKIGDKNNKDLVKVFNKNKNQVKKKTLLITHQDLSSKKKNNEAALRKIYKYDLKIVEPEEIWKAIEEQREDICYALIFYENRNLKLKAIIQAKDSKVLYGEVSKKSNGLFKVTTKTLKAVLGK